VDVHSILFPKMDVPADVVDPWKKNMTGNANNENLFTKWPHLDLWVPVSRHKKKDPIDPLPPERGPHGGRGV